MRTAIALTLACVLAGLACTEPKDPGGAFVTLSLRYAGAVNITSANVIIFDEAASCNGAVAQGGRELVRQTVIIGSSAHIEVSVGRRTVSVIALDGATTVARGCGQVTVSSGASTTVEIDLEEIPGAVDAMPDAEIPDGPGEDECMDAGIVETTGAPVMGSTTVATDDVTITCAPGGGADVFFSFTLLDPSEVDIVLDDTGSGQNALALFSDTCDLLMAEAQCANAGDPDTFSNLNLAAGTYYLVVEETAPGAGGPFTLTVTAAQFEDCANPGILALGGGMVTGDYGSAANDTAGSCGGGGGRDQVYRLNVPDFQYVRVATAGAGSFATYVRTVCNLLGAEIGTPICDATLPGQVDLGLVSGDHYVWIDALGGGPSTYDVTATTLPPPNDVCPGTTVMAGLTRGTLIGGNNTNPAATCGGTGNDVFYTFTTAVDRHLVATVTAANAATNPVVSLRTTCTDVGTELDCSNVGAGASETLDIPTLPAGTYFLMVDSQGAASSFSLDLTLAAPVAANDTCSSPLAIAPPGIASTLRFAGDQEQGMAPACNDGGATDVIYSFTAAALQDLTLTITPTNFDASVYVRRGACRTGLQIGCADAGAVGGAETINVVDLAADTYYVIVEKKAGAAGESFDIGLTLGP